MNVLWLTREDPRFLDSGDLIYSFGLIRSLAQTGQTVHVICSGRSDQTPLRDLGGAVVESVTPQLRSRLGSLWSSLPSDPYRLAFSAIAEKLSAALATGAYDAIVVDHLAMGWAFDRIVRQAKKRLPLFYVAHNHERVTRLSTARLYGAASPKRPLFLYDAFKYGLLERKLVAAGSAISCICDQDAAGLSRDYSVKPVVLYPGYSGSRPEQLADIAALPRRCVMVGSFDWHAKRENLLRFVEAVRKPFTEAGIELQLVGKGEQGFITELRRRAPFCDVVGYARDVTPFLRGARIGIMADTAGGGFKMKLLDYAFNGLPIATIASQSAGMPESFPTWSIVADDLDQLARAIVKKIDQPALLDRMRHDALNACQERFNWERTGQKLKSALESVALTRSHIATHAT